MGWFDRFLPRPPEVKSETALRDLIAVLGARPSAAGVQVDHLTAMQVPTVLVCARVIAEGLAQVPWKLYRSLPGGGRVEARDHPLYTLVNQAPNPWQTSFEFRETMGLHAALCGNAYVLVQRATDGSVQELLPFAPNLVKVKQRVDWTLEYQISRPNGMGFFTVAEAEMWHLRGPSWDSVCGLKAVDVARNAIGLAIATEEFGSQFFANGARPSGILSPETGVTYGPEQIAMAKEAWQAAHGGANKLGTAFLDGLKYEKVSTEPEEAQFTETRQAQVLEICRAFRVLPVMAMVTDTTSYASVEQMLLAHLTHTLAPWFARFLQSAEMKLLTADERRQGYHFELDDKGMLRGSAKERAEFHALMLQHGVESVNEVRALEGLNPLGPDFDKPHRAQNLYKPEGEASPPPPAVDEGTKARIAALETMAETLVDAQAKTLEQLRRPREIVAVRDGNGLVQKMIEKGS